MDRVQYSHGVTCLRAYNDLERVQVRSKLNVLNVPFEDRQQGSLAFSVVPIHDAAGLSFADRPAVLFPFPL